MTPQTIDLPGLYTRAAVGSVNESNRTADVIFSTGAPVDRMDPTGRRYREVLSLEPSHVRLGRLNSSAPLLNSHSAFSISDVIGVVEPGSARTAPGRATATVRFSQRGDVAAIWQDVVDGIIRSVSVGYRVHKVVEDAPKGGGLPTMTAIDWEPYELSMVSIPADPGAHVRHGHVDVHPCVIVAREHEPSGDLVRALRFELSRYTNIGAKKPTSKDLDPLRLLRLACIESNVSFPEPLRQLF